MYKTLTNGAISGETYFPLLFLLLYPITFSVLTYHSVHCGSIRQTATILSMNRDCLRTGDKASVHFRFIKTPEYLHCDQRLVFREGRTKAVGTITKVVQPSRTSTKDDVFSPYNDVTKPSLNGIILRTISVISIKGNM